VVNLADSCLCTLFMDTSKLICLFKTQLTKSTACQKNAREHTRETLQNKPALILCAKSVLVPNYDQQHNPLGFILWANDLITVGLNIGFRI